MKEIITKLIEFQEFNRALFIKMFLKVVQLIQLGKNLSKVFNLKMHFDSEDLFDQKIFEEEEKFVKKVCFSFLTF